MIDRVTFRVRDGIAVTGVGKIYDPAKRKTRTMAGAVIRLAEYEDTDLDPREIRRLKAERDAAVRDIVEAMEVDLSMCVLTHQCWFCAFYNSDDCPLEKDGECAPKWRGPQQEET